VPFNSTLELAINPVPVIATAVAGAPSITEEGVTPPIVGTGFCAGGGLVVPPPPPPHPSINNEHTNPRTSTHVERFIRRPQADNRI